MSLARVYTTQKSRKVWTCSKPGCGKTIPLGSKVYTYAVGFRGRDQRRCEDHYPTLSERESSAIANIYAAQEDIDLANCQTLEELQDAVQQVVDAANEVADEYEANEMYDVNYDLQERAETIRSAADELEQWDSGLVDAPSDEDDEDYAEEFEEWIEEARSAAQEALDNMELP